MKKLISWEDAPVCKKQIEEPCSDCPWRRDALPGWLGTDTAKEWLGHAHGETLVDCHALRGPQCAGLAIYRANVGKLCRDSKVLRLPSDKKAVFMNPTEFLNHHDPDGSDD